MTEKWTDKMGKKALRRYRFTLTLKIIRVLLIILFIGVIYQMVLQISYSKTDNQEKLQTYAQLAAEWTMPGVMVDRHGNFGDISALMTERTLIDLKKRVGSADKGIGTREIHKPLVTSFTRIDDTINDQDVYSEYQFYLPYDPRTDNQLAASSGEVVWETLERLHEGTVTEIAFSFDEYYRTEEVMEIFDDYDLTVSWLPLYMGELKNFDTDWSAGGDTLRVDPWGLSSAQYFDENWRNHQTGYLSLGNIEEVETQMIHNMNLLYEEDESLAEAMFQVPKFEERVEFLEEEGFKVYGAVVTGPSKELLKLQEEEMIRGEQIGPIEYWNWSPTY
ncbi:anti-sigma factor [Salipaludibacillus daqingensis]|uniref:anti-sigma factor n=1 Tax=Salipaludibacillus daqingensis TaxID=3041001 RepID=UPI0024737B37|nr:anti-sigma factor [Salipaludibacillus daqingensis]